MDCQQEPLVGFLPSLSCLYQEFLLFFFLSRIKELQNFPHGMFSSRIKELKKSQPAIILKFLIKRKEDLEWEKENQELKNYRNLSQQNS